MTADINLVPGTFYLTLPPNLLEEVVVVALVVTNCLHFDASRCFLCFRDYYEKNSNQNET